MKRLTQGSNKFSFRALSLIYLIFKHERPELGNWVRELAEDMNGSTQSHCKMLLWDIKYTTETKDYALALLPDAKNRE